VALEVAEVLGDFDLRLAKHGLEVANTERAVQQEVEYPQTGPVTETFVDANEVHGKSIRLLEYTAIGILKS
jgi:hypothetical protein